MLYYLIGNKALIYLDKLDKKRTRKGQEKNTVFLGGGMRTVYLCKQLSKPHLKKTIMKKHLLLLFSALFLLGNTWCRAFDFGVGALVYNITDAAAGEVEVTYLDSGTPNGDFFVGNITVPSQVLWDGKIYQVTGIGEQAFHNCKQMTGISLPATLNYIGAYAFRSCSALTNISIPFEVTDIGEYAFLDCSALASVGFPRSLATVGESAFSGCSELTSVSLPEGVTTISKRQFYGCEKLARVTLPDFVTAIGDYAFMGCKALSVITLPRNVESVGMSAFQGCTALTDITSRPAIPPTLGLNALGAFSGDIYVPNASIEAYKAADGWNALADHIATLDGREFTVGRLHYLITNSSTNPSVTLIYADKEISDNATIPASVIDAKGNTYAVTAISNSAFESCTQLTGITINAKVSTIPWYCFDNCHSLKSVKLPDTVEEIQGAAFCYNYALTSITLPKKLKVIGPSAFAASGLTSIEFPSSLTTLEENSFGWCGSLKTITWGKGGVSVKGSVFQHTALEEVTLPKNVHLYASSTFADCTSLRSFTADIGSVWENVHYTFWNDTALESVTFPNAYYLFDNNFRGCTNLSEVTFLEGSVDPMRHFGTNFQHVDRDVRVNIPEGTAEDFLRAGYRNLSDLSGLPMAREEFERQAALLANAGIDEVINAARTKVNAAEDYLTIFAQIDAIREAATGNLATTGADCTGLIANPAFDASPLGWTIDTYTGWGNTGFQTATYENDGVTIQKFVEQWAEGSPIDDVTFSQTLKQLPEGVYRLEADAVATYQNDPSIDVKGVKLFAGTETVGIATANAAPQHFTLRFVNRFVQDITIGMRVQQTNANWVAVDNFKLIRENDIASAPAGVTNIDTVLGDTLYLHNVGADRFLNQGNAWGTHAVVAETGLPLEVVKYGADNSYYRIHFLDNVDHQALLFSDDNENVWVDYNGQGDDLSAWAITGTGSLKRIQNLNVLNSDATSGFLAWEAFHHESFQEDVNTDVFLSDEGSTAAKEWKFLTKEQYQAIFMRNTLLDAILKAENQGFDVSNARTVYLDMNATLADLRAAYVALNMNSVVEPVENNWTDMTAFIINPRFEDNTTEGWTIEGGANAGGVAKSTDFQCKEFYQTNFDMHQHITGLPNGTYVLRFKGLARNGSWQEVCAAYDRGEDVALAEVYTHSGYWDATQPLVNIAADRASASLDGSDQNWNGTYVPDRMQGARAHFDLGFYSQDLMFEVTDGTLDFGIRNVAEMGSERWVIFTDFKLYYVVSQELNYNRMEVSDLRVVSGMDVTLPIELKNRTDRVNAAQFTLTLPEGATIARDGDEFLISTTTRGNNCMLTAEENENGTYTILLKRNSGSIATGEGAVMNITLHIDENMTDIDRWITLSNVQLTVGRETIHPYSSTARMNVLEINESQINVANAVINSANPKQYGIYTVIDDTRYYLTADGYLTTEPRNRAQCYFTFHQISGSGLFHSPGQKLNACFTNPKLSENNGQSGELLPQGHILTNLSNNRDSWEGQVWYLGDNGCFAVRATNANSQNWGAASFWTVLDTNRDGWPEADYSWIPDFIWQLESDILVGIDDLDGDAERKPTTDNAIYDLSGRTIHQDEGSSFNTQRPSLPKGIYIRGGKKMVVK